MAGGLLSKAKAIVVDYHLRIWLLTFMPLPLAPFTNMD